MPRWLRQDLVNGIGAEWAAPRLPRVRMRVCAACNARMNVAFEVPARPVLLRMMSGARWPMTLDERRVAAFWMIKTDILYGILRIVRDNVEPGVHPKYQHRWDPGQRLADHRANLMRLTRDGIAPPRTIVSAALMEVVEPSRCIPITPRDDGDFVSRGVNVWMPLVYETIQGDRDPAAHATLRLDDGRFVVLWPPRMGESALWPPAPISFTEVRAFRASEHGHLMPLLRLRPGDAA